MWWAQAGVKRTKFIQWTMFEKFLVRTKFIQWTMDCGKLLWQDVGVDLSFVEIFYPSNHPFV